MKKKLLSLALALVMCLGLTIMPAAAASNDIAKVAAGINTFLMLTEGGTLYGVGGTYSELTGIPGGGDERVSVPIVLMNDVRSMATTNTGSVIKTLQGRMLHYTGKTILAIKTNGDLYSWGANEVFQLGLGDRDTHEGPQLVMHNVKEADCGASWAAAVTESGDLYIWGALTTVDSKNDEIHYYQQPTKVLSDVKTIACGDYHLLAITNDGSVYAMGSTCNYAVGNGVGFRPFLDNTATGFVSEMTKVFDNCVEVSAGCGFSLALRADGTLFGWGDNDHNQLGYDSTRTNNGTGPVSDDGNRLYAFQKTPYQIMTGVKAIDAGDTYALVLKTDNSLWGMGYTYSCQFGVDTWTYYNNGNVPMKVMSNVKTFSAGYEDSAIVAADGVMYGCGQNLGWQIEEYVVDINDDNGSVVETPKVCGLSVGDKFSDVPFTNFAHDPVTWAVEQGITSGTSSTTFSPGKTCSQGEILTFLWRAKGSPKPSGAVSGTEFYASAVQWAEEQGLIGGSFSPSGPCTRSDVVTYLWKLAGSPAASGSSFTDVPAGADYAQAVAWAVKEGITAGTSATTFSPGSTCTRGQIVTFLYRNFAQ